MAGFDYSNTFAAYNTYLKNANLYTAPNNNNAQNTQLPQNVSSPMVDGFNSSKKPSADSKFDYSVDDGKISFGDKVKNFGKGLISPITNMFSSPKNFLIGASMIALGAAAIVVTGGAIAPVLVAAGVAGGAVQFGVSAYKAANAETDAQAQAAWQGMGAGTSTVGLSALGAKASLKGAGLVDDASNLNCLQATAKCFKATPGQFGKSFTNAKNFLGITAKNPVTTKAPVEEPVVKQEPKTEPKVETKPAEQKSVEQPKVKTDAVEAEVKVEQSKVEAKVEPKVEPKAKPVENAEPPKVEAKPAEQPKVEPKVETKPLQEPGIEKSTDLKLSKAEDLALKEYKTDEGYLADALRKGKATPDSEYMDTINIIDDIFVKHGTVLKDDIILYRGVRNKLNTKTMEYEPFFEAKIGNVIPDKSFVSTSKDFKIASSGEFASTPGKTGYVFEIKVPKGTRVLDIDSLVTSYRESEILLPRNSSFVIREVKPDGVLVLDMLQ